MNYEMKFGQFFNLHTKKKVKVIRSAYIKNFKHHEDRKQVHANIYYKRFSITETKKVQNIHHKAKTNTIKFMRHSYFLHS